jgi:nucleoside-diphosphate-sugar epimerase
MRILFIGGTGNISTACTLLAISLGHRVTLLNRSLHDKIPGTEQLTVDINDQTAAATAVAGKHWDAVVDFITFTPDVLERRLALLRGKIGQYFFISSASAYQKPVSAFPITESTPLANPHWQYSRDKIACEDRLLQALREENFPCVIIRPSLTYGDTIIPLAVNSWLKSYTAVDRMRRGLPVIVPGDGLTRWTITHNSDFAKGLVGLLGQDRAIGQAFNIVSEEAPTWDQIYLATAKAAGVPSPKLVHIATDFIVACLPELEGTLLGDKSHTAEFDTAKLRRFVPGFQPTTLFSDGISRSIAWFDADPRRRVIDDEANAKWDKLIGAYQRGLELARREFA